MSRFSLMMKSVEAGEAGEADLLRTSGLSFAATTAGEADGDGDGEGAGSGLALLSVAQVNRASELTSLNSSSSRTPGSVSNLVTRLVSVAQFFVFMAPTIEARNE